MSFSESPQFERPSPLTKKDAALADAYDLRYPGIEISEGRKAWRGGHELRRGRLSLSDIASAPERRAYRERIDMTLTCWTRSGRQVTKLF